MIRIVADAHIPAVAKYLADTGQLHLMPGRKISAADVRDSEVLVVRSVTPVNRDLLRGSRVRLVASATAGIDHIDVEYLNEHGISLAHAPGANAESVVEYVLAAMFAIAAESGTSLRGATVGIVGFGNVGGRLGSRLKAFGCRVVVNDPPLADATGDFAPGFETADLEETVGQADILTLHVPLESRGPHPTRELIGRRLLEAMRPGAWFINTSRGAVVEEDMLLEHVSRADAGPAVLDVWRTEPVPDPRLVEMVRIGTPHVAGYSVDAKLMATRAVARAVREFCGLKGAEEVPKEGTVELRPPAAGLGEESWYHAVIRQMYDIERDSQQFRQSYAGSPDPADSFAKHRNEYPVRRSFRRYRMESRAVPAGCPAVADVLGIVVSGESGQS